MEPPDEGVYTYGFFLEGARWNHREHYLEDSRPRELFTELPPLHFIPEKDRVSNPADYACPCYK
eukprot:4186930-Amphidinium_carterae.1